MVIGGMPGPPGAGGMSGPGDGGGMSGPGEGGGMSGPGCGGMSGPPGWGGTCWAWVGRVVPLIGSLIVTSAYSHMGNEPGRTRFRFSR